MQTICKLIQNMYKTHMDCMKTKNIINKTSTKLNMKHTKRVLILFLALFIISQLLGLSLVSLGAKTTSTINNETQEEIHEVEFANTTVGERPEVEGTQTIISIVIGIAIGTTILLLLSKFNKINIWRHWFFFASIITMSISFGVLTNNFLIAWILAIILGAWKIYKPNYIIHNFTELFIYPGIALLIVPLLNVFYAFILLILISIYDAYAVWRSKHMITMAEFAKRSKLFPGLAITYDDKQVTNEIKSEKNITEKDNKQKTKQNKKTDKIISKTGILGGGDIAFPLIFSATFLVFLLEEGYSNAAAIGYSFIISLFAGIALILLFLYGKRNAYYPAMPFISAGCFIGYLVVIGLMYLI